MHILIAPNAFKHALDAPDVAASIQKGLAASQLSCTAECFPIGDGGNGTGRLIIERCKGTFIHVRVKDPLGRPVSASFGLIENGQTAVIEMADASGLHLLTPETLDPLHASSYGTGELVRAALDKGVTHVVIGMGGSATVDGGSGILAALGVRFLDRQGQPILDLPYGLQRLHAIDRSAVDERLKNCRITILCDVLNPLLGEKGAARIFGPQKGANPEMVEQLEDTLRHYAGVIFAETGINLADIRSGGVAGGASAGLYGLLEATLANGIDYFLDLTRFDESLAKSDLVITAEGSIDTQTLEGKGPFGVASRAKNRNIPVIGLAGKVPVEDHPALKQYFDVLLAIGNGPVPLEEALRTTSQNLVRTATQLGDLIAQFGRP